MADSQNYLRLVRCTIPTASTWSAPYSISGTYTTLNSGYDKAFYIINDDEILILSKHDPFEDYTDIYLIEYYKSIPDPNLSILIINGYIYPMLIVRIIGTYYILAKPFSYKK